MKWLLALAGAFAGAFFADGGTTALGIALGVAFGFGTGWALGLARRVESLEQELQRLAAQRVIDAMPTRTPAPMTAPAAERNVEPATSAAESQPEPADEPADERAPTPAPSAAAPAPPQDGWSQSPVGPPVSLLDNALVRAVRDYFTGGNTLVRVGVVVLFFGVAFLLRYVAERTTLPMQYRLAGVAFGALVMLVLGWRLRRRRAGYALALQGGAVGILYLTVFAALRLYALLPPAAAFALLVVITALTAALAVLQDSLAFAMLAAAGGFLAPILASTGEGNHVTLFSYYAVLNAGLVGIAWFKAWRPLTLLGFAFTFIIGTVWGVLRYQSPLFASTEPFLILFFLFYVLMAVLFALRQPPDLRGYVDGSIVFGVPVAAFALQTALLREDTAAGGLGLALSALAVGGLYILLAAWLWRTHRETLRLLTESFLALGIAFLTLAIPLALDGHWTAASWALEGAALLWVGCRQQRKLPRAAGALLQVGAGLLFALRGTAVGADAWPLLNSAWLGGVMVAAAAVFSTLALRRVAASLADYERPLAALLFVWGVLWWTVGGVVEIERVVAEAREFAATLGFFTLTALLASGLTQRAPLPMARWVALALLPAAGFMTLTRLPGSEHVLADFGWLAWPAAFGVLLYVLRQHVDETYRWLVTAMHSGIFWLFALVSSLELIWLAGRATHDAPTWTQLAAMAVPCGLLAALPAATRRVAWPFAQHTDIYRLPAAAGLALWLVGWLLVVNASSDGNAAPLPYYVPLLNPLDIASGLIVFTLARHWQVLEGDPPPALAEWNPRIVYGVLASLGFLWLNAALLRAVHHLAGVPFELDALLGNTLVQVALSIFWTVLALGVMLLATRRANRIVWIVGAALLGVVVVKLFLIDLSRVGSVERIVSFVVVGLLMLVIGYFSPLPPPRAQAAEGESRS